MFRHSGPHVPSLQIGLAESLHSLSALQVLVDVGVVFDFGHTAAIINVSAMHPNTTPMINGKYEDLVEDALVADIFF